MSYRYTIFKWDKTAPRNGHIDFNGLQRRALRSAAPRVQRTCTQVFDGHRIAIYIYISVTVPLGTDLYADFVI